MKPSAIFRNAAELVAESLNNGACSAIRSAFSDAAVNVVKEIEDLRKAEDLFKVTMGSPSWEDGYGVLGLYWWPIDNPYSEDYRVIALLLMALIAEES